MTPCPHCTKPLICTHCNEPINICTPQETGRLGGRGCSEIKREALKRNALKRWEGHVKKSKKKSKNAKIPD